MDRRTVKKLLLLRRPWLTRESDEHAAAKLAEADSELSAFARKQELFNEQVHRALNEIPIPSNLREQILTRRKVIRGPFWRQYQALLGLAASLLLLAAGLFYWLHPREDTTFAGFRSRMIGFAILEYRMDVLTSDLTELKTFLAGRGGPADFSLPPGLVKTPLKGGARLSWQGNAVSMVCFDWAKGETLYMFVTDAPKARVPTVSPRIQPLKGLATATWTNNGKTFLVAGHIPEDRLADLVKS